MEDHFILEHRSETVLVSSHLVI